MFLDEFDVSGCYLTHLGGMERVWMRMRMTSERDGGRWMIGLHAQRQRPTGPVHPDTKRRYRVNQGHPIYIHGWKNRAYFQQMDDFGEKEGRASSDGWCSICIGDGNHECLVARGEPSVGGDHSGRSLERWVDRTVGGCSCGVGVVREDLGQERPPKRAPLDE